MGNEKITPAQVVLPVFMLALSLVVFLGFQTSLLVNERNAIANAYSQQTKPLEQAEKIKIQLSGLVSGAVKLAQSGNKNAQAVVDQMKKAGILQDKPAEAAAPKEGEAAVSAPAPEEAAEPKK